MGTGIQQDVYCLTCGYNLRGLSGDPVRCPECGELNSLAAISLPAAGITKHLRQLETGPAACVGSFQGAVLFGFLAVRPLFAPPGAASGHGSLLMIAVGFLAAWSWWFGMKRFQRGCLGRREWRALLARHHLIGLPSTTPGVLVVMWMVFLPRISVAYLTGGVAVAVGLSALAWWGLRGPRMQLKQRMEAMARRVAVEVGQAADESTR